MTECETIGSAISNFTGALYEVREPSPTFPRSKSKVTWLLVSPIPVKERTKAVAPFIWEAEDGILSVESIQLADSAEWIYGMYGERGAAKAQDIEREYSKREIKAVLKKHFPRVHKRALQYEKILSGVSTKTGVSLEMEYDRNRFIITLYAVARIEARNLDTQAKIERIKLSIDAIKEALLEVDKYEAKLTDASR